MSYFWAFGDIAWSNLDTAFLRIINSVHSCYSSLEKLMTKSNKVTDVFFIEILLVFGKEMAMAIFKRICIVKHKLLIFIKFSNL